MSEMTFYTSSDWTYFRLDDDGVWRAAEPPATTSADNVVIGWSVEEDSA